MRRNAHRILTAVLVVCLYLFASGCASMWASVKSSAAPAGGAAGGAAIGALAPPFGPIIGAAIGAVIVHAISENASLRSGETVGAGALERWAVDDPAGMARSYVAAKEGESFYKKWRWRIMWLAIAYIAFLRRQWVWKTLTGAGVQSRFWTFIHALTGGDGTRILALGYNPIPKTEPQRQEAAAKEGPTHV